MSSPSIPALSGLPPEEHPLREAASGLIGVARDPAFVEAHILPLLAEARDAMAGGLGEARLVEPDEEWMAVYDRLYRTAYSRLAPALSPIHDALAPFRGNPTGGDHAP